MDRTDLRYLKGFSEDSVAPSDQAGEQQESIQMVLARVTDLDEASEAITQALVSRVAKMQQVALEEIDPSRFLHSYGVDSLVAIEIVNWALKEIKSKINVFDVMAGIPITALADNIARKSDLIPKEVRED
ncbi:highly reducing polyketide synthase cla2 [Colletotrichum liriopes]|uniref:Highly reducing polyketide synthase cla2 n=1 Tax=Colletotrichum liriopes TaxID=708192 RepID=A0AA37GN32_9PEZI|nr:highly reducing polyketide synthase cla2 [Colletotrichum liriopes]